MAVAFVVGTIDIYPVRISLAATGLTPGDIVTIYRDARDGAGRTPVRGGDAVVAASDAIVLEDAEQRFGTLIDYYLVVNGVEIDDNTIYSALDGGKVAITDAINGNAAEVVVTAWPEKTRTRNASQFQVAGRNIVVVGERGQFTSTLEIYTETEDSRLNFLTLLDNATSGILQVRQAGTYKGVDCYVAVISDIEKRWSQDGSDERRVFSLDVVEVSPWAAGLETSGYTYEDVAAAYATYTDLANDFTTYLELAQGVF